MTDLRRRRRRREQVRKDTPTYCARVFTVWRTRASTGTLNY